MGGRGGRIVVRPELVLVVVAASASMSLLLLLLLPLLQLPSENRDDVPIRRSVGCSVCP